MSRVAILIDGENIAHRYFPEIARRCLTLGHIRSSQVFADFSGGKREGWVAVCQEFGVQPVLQLSAGKGKNSVDIAIVIAAMDLLHQRAADTICIVSSDRDFIPLAQRLRGSDVGVVGIGLQASDKGLAESCDSFFLLKPIAKTSAAPLATAATSSADKPTLSRDERAFVADLIRELCNTSGKTSVAPSVVGVELRKRNAKLADRLSNGKLLKHLRRNQVVVEHGDGSTKTVSARAA